MDEGKTLVIPILSGNYLINNDSTKDISVTLMLAGLKDGVEGEETAFIQNEYSFTYRINGTKDSTPPVLKTLNLARTREDAINGTNLITQEEFTHYAAKANYGDDSSKVAANIQNHHVNKVWVYFEAEDDQSGAAYLEIKEQLIRDTSAVEIVGIIFDKTNSESNCIKNQSNYKNFSGSFEYEFKSYEDGVAKLDFCLFDYAGKSDSKSVDLVKDTQCLINLSSCFIQSEHLYVEDIEDPHNAPYENIKIELYHYSQKAENKYITDLDGQAYFEAFESSNQNDFSHTVKVIGLEYGNNINDMTYIDLRNKAKVEKHGTKYYRTIEVPTICVDLYKEVYVRTIMLDTAGNVSSYDLTIPQIPAVVDFVQRDFAKDSVNKTELSPVRLDSTTDEQYGGLKFFTINNNNQKVEFNPPQTSNIVQYIYNSDDCNSQPSNLIMTCRNCVNGSFRTYYGKSIKLKRTGNTWEVFSEESNQLMAQDIPSFEIETSEAKADNSGVRKVKVKFDNSFSFNPNYKYLIKLNNKYYSQTDFTLKTQSTPYNLSVVVFNNSGQKIESESKTITINYDNVAPSFNFFLTNFENGSFVAKIKPEDNEGGSGIEKNDGKPFVKYLFISSDINVNDIDWDNNPKVRIAKFIDNIYANLEVYEELPQGIVLYLKDNNGNYKIEKQKFLTDRIQSPLKVYYNGTTFIEQTTYESSEWSARNEYISSNKWTKIESISNSTWGMKALSTKAGNTYSTGITLNNDEQASFVRVAPFLYTSVGRWKYCFSTPIYFYPPYLIAKKNNTSFDCALKDYYIGHAGINILADQPCFAHTLYCPRDLGDTAEAWLNGGLETGLVMKQKSFTYSYDNTAGVPDGYYYTTIIHFADGTTLMTDVKQKND